MPKQANQSSIEKALQLLSENGYTVKKQVQYTKKTFEVSLPTLEQVREVQEALGYKLKDVVEEAFIRWLEYKSAEYDKVIKAKGRAKE